MSSPISKNNPNVNYSPEVKSTGKKKPVPEKDLLEVERIMAEVKDLLRQRDELLGKNTKK